MVCKNAITIEDTEEHFFFGSVSIWWQWRLNDEEKWFKKIYLYCENHLVVIIISILETWHWKKYSFEKKIEYNRWWNPQIRLFETITARDCRVWNIVGTGACNYECRWKQVWKFPRFCETRRVLNEHYFEIVLCLKHQTVWC